MAHILSASGPAHESPRWWPVDKILLWYFAAATLLELALWTRLPDSAGMLFWHATGVAALVVAQRFEGRVKAVPRLSAAIFYFRHWYAILYVAACYREMSVLIPAVRSTDADAALANLDRAIWGANPTVWLERWHSPLLTEILQIVYSGFVPAVLGVAFVLWMLRRYGDFRYYGFLIALGFLASYIGYLMVPARGPRFLLNHLQSFELRGLWLYEGLRTTLDRLEKPHFDCFPSGHTEMMVLAWWGSRQISPNLARFFFVYTLGVIFATVYLRYHYTVDVVAGAVLAGVLIWSAPHIYRTLGGEAAYSGRSTDRSRG